MRLSGRLWKTKLALAAVPPRYRLTYFSHIWASGYSAGYYAYLWSEMLDDDAFAWFAQHGGLTRANGDRFRRMVLSRGNTQDLESLYEAWRGGAPGSTDCCGSVDWHCRARRSEGRHVRVASAS